MTQLSARTRTAWFGVVLTAVGVGRAPAAAQPLTAPAVTTIADGIFTIRHPNASGWVHGNTTVVVGEREVLVVDSCFTSVRAREDIAEINEVRKAVDLAAMKTLFAGDDANRGANFDATIGERLVTIVYYELKQR